MPNALSDKCALITGASSGLGRSLAIAFSSYCSKLYLTGTHEKNLHRTATLCNDNCNVNVLSADLKHKKNIYRLLESTAGDIDILLNVAGIFSLTSIADTTDGFFEECMSVNVTAPFILSRELMKRMQTRGWGRIINIGSSSSYAGSEISGAYCTSKHALLGLTRSLFQELRETGVRVHFIAPGSLQTPMGKEDYRQDYDTFIDPDEVASFIVHVASYNTQMIGEELRLNRVVIR